MRRIEKKVLPKYFDLIAVGKKNFELRLDEFEVNEGDVLILREFDPDTGYTGRVMEKVVGYVFHFKPDQLFWSEEEVKDKGLMILDLR